MTEQLVEFGWETFEAPENVVYLDPVVRPFLPQAGRVLDVGCGNGAFSDRLARRGYEVVGIDASADGIEIARRQASGRYEQDQATPGLLERLGEEPFDAVVSLEVVEHVYDPHAWAVACFGALHPGGTLVCSTPYHGYAKNLALALAGKFDFHWHPLRTGGHIKFWSRATLSELLERNGFRVVGFAGAGRVPYLWKSMVVVARRPGSETG
jgi:2-polyprenyl-6-hydroxyphenyl methylase/3-demethylubiquinone-9 3-methyltransferase